MRMKSGIPAISAEEFDERTGLRLIEIVADAANRAGRAARDRDSCGPTVDQLTLFCEYAAALVRWSFANRDDWRCVLLSKRDDGAYARDICRAWVELWGAEFFRDPSRYLLRYDIAELI